MLKISEARYICQKELHTESGSRISENCMLQVSKLEDWIHKRPVRLNIPILYTVDVELQDLRFSMLDFCLLCLCLSSIYSHLPHFEMGTYILLSLKMLFFLKTYIYVLIVHGVRRFFFKCQN